MSPTRGRPRNFCTDTVLEQAMQVFWEKGFQGATLSDLTAATGLNKPSLYAAYGDKEALYLKALNLYIQKHGSHHLSILERETDGRVAIENFLLSVAATHTDACLPGGCLMVSTSTQCAANTTPDSISAAIKEGLIMTEQAIYARLQKAQTDQHLAPLVNVEELAALFITLVEGFSVMAKSGASFTKLQQVIHTAMQVWVPAQPVSQIQKKRTTPATTRQSVKSS